MAMLSSRVLFTAVAVPLFAAAAVIACGDDTENTTVPTVEGGASSSGGSSGSSGGSSGTSSSGSSSGGVDDGGEDSGCAIVETPEAPNLDGGKPCGTVDFGGGVIAFKTDAGLDLAELDGGAFKPGIYDVVEVESPLMAGGTWRETTVIGPNNRITRARELRPGNSTDPASYMSGTITRIENGSAYVAVDCQDGDGGLDASTSFPVEFVEACGATYFKVGAGNTRAFLKRR